MFYRNRYLFSTPKHYRPGSESNTQFFLLFTSTYPLFFLLFHLLFRYTFPCPLYPFIRSSNWKGQFSDTEIWRKKWNEMKSEIIKCLGGAVPVSTDRKWHNRWWHIWVENTSALFSEILCAKIKTIWQVCEFFPPLFLNRKRYAIFKESSWSKY